jgi:hypothetical protein
VTKKTARFGVKAVPIEQRKKRRLPVHTTGLLPTSVLSGPQITAERPIMAIYTPLLMLTTLALVAKVSAMFSAAARLPVEDMGAGMPQMASITTKMAFLAGEC